MLVSFNPGFLFSTPISTWEGTVPGSNFLISDWYVSTACKRAFQLESTNPGRTSGGRNSEILSSISSGDISCSIVLFDLDLASLPGAGEGFFFIGAV